MTTTRHLPLGLLGAAAALLLTPAVAVAHESAPTMPTASGPTSGGSLRLVAVAALTAVVAYAIRRSVRSFRPALAQDVIAVSLLFTAAVHCALTRPHWTEKWYLGAFFALSGLVLLGQSVLVWMKPSVASYAGVIVSTTVLVALYFISRETTLPLIDHRDPYLLEDYPAKLAEGVAAALAVVALLSLRAKRVAPVPV